MANIILPGYLTYWGNKITITFDHTGPVSYSNIGTSSGTGDLLKASDFGIGGIEFLDFQQWGGGLLYTASGNYALKVFTASSGTAVSVAAQQGAAIPSFVLQWFTATTFSTIGSEVANGTNLSAEYIRCQIQGV